MRTLIVALAFASLTAHAAAPSADAKLAEKIVGDVAGVKDGEVVVISGNYDDRAFMSELTIAVGKRGGAPLVMVDDQAMMRRWLDEVPATRDKTWAAAYAKMVPVADVMLVVDRRDSSLMKGVPPERSTQLSQAFVGLDDARIKRGMRIVYIGNGLFPTKGAAHDVGVSEGELKKAYEAGLATDYKALAASGDAVKATLAAGKEVTVKTKAGTDLKFKIGKKPFFVSDGVISADEAKAGGAALMTWLPAGEVYGLIEGAEGKIVEPSRPWEGGEIKDLTLEIKGGKIVSVTAKPSKAFDSFKAQWDALPAGKEVLSVVDLGVNPDVKVKGKPLRNFVPAGMVTFNWGNDTWAGGTNATAGGGGAFLHDATVTVDGAVVIDAGTLKVAAK